MKRFLSATAFLFSAVSWTQSSSLDGFIAPSIIFNYPFFEAEVSYSDPILLAAPRIGFRIESGRISDNIAVDFRFAARSWYTDFGGQLKLFECLNQGSSALLCLGVGAGLSYSQDLPSESGGRSFVDPQVQPFLRFIFDTEQQVGFFVEGSVLASFQRSFFSGDPKLDKEDKIRAELAVGLILDFDKAQESISFTLGGSGSSVPSLDRSGVFVGVKGGFPLSKFLSTASDGSAGTGASSNLGIMGGLSGDFGASQWGVMADVLFASRRYGLDKTTSMAVDWIHVPVHLRWRNMDSTFLMLGAGGYGAIPLGKARITSGTDFGQETETTYGFDYGLSGGGGFGLESSVATFTIELRYNYGLANLLKEPVDSEKLTTRTWDLLIGFMF